MSGNEGTKTGSGWTDKERVYLSHPPLLTPKPPHNKTDKKKNKQTAHLPLLSH